MFREFFDKLRRANPPAPRYVPSSPSLPALWPSQSSLHPQPNLAVLDAASTDVLKELCDDYWNSYFAVEDDAHQGPIITNDGVHRRALELLAERGTEALEWARASLTHRGYDAREDAAALIMQLAERQTLGEEAEHVSRELAELAVRPIEEDTKEAQANCAALMALSKIGGPICLSAVRRVLTSPEWDEDDNQWEAADILSRLTGEPFMEEDDPVAAAKRWLQANPPTES